MFKPMEDLVSEMNGLVNEMQGTVNNVRNIDHIPYQERDVHYMELIIRGMNRVQKRMAAKIAKHIENEETKE